VVGEIVKQVHAFSLATDLSRALQTSIIDPTLKAYLPEAIGKLGRYYSATSEPVCAARHRDYRLFESIEVEPFQIPMPASLSMSYWKFTQRYSSSSFMRFIQADSDQGLSALARVLVTCAIYSSPSTAASIYLGPTAGSTPAGSYQTG
jgi:hypothetical protein